MMKKKILFILLAFVVGGTMASCNGDDGGDEDVDADVPQEDIPSEAEIDVPPDVPTEDVPVDDVTPDEEDTVEEDMIEEDAADVPVTAEVSGRVWFYAPMMSTFTAEPTGGLSVIAEASGLTPADYTVTTSTTNCEDWWSTGEPFDCGRYSIGDIPAGTVMMLRAQPSDSGDPDTISRLFNVDDAGHEVLVVVDQELINGLLTAWSITQNPDYGLVVGILVETVNPDPTYSPTGTEDCPDNPAACELSGFIGDATVDVSPDPTCTDCMDLVYYNGSDYTDTSRTATDPTQSLFFIANVPAVLADDPYTLTVTHGSHTFDSVQFAVEGGNVTYLLIIPTA